MTTASTLHTVWWERLQTAIGIDVYDAEVPASPPTDPDGRVRAYAVLFDTPGTAMASSMDATQTCILGNVQINCYGGDPTRALACVDAVRTALVGYVTVGGLSRHIRAREEDLGMLVDPDAAWPPRYYAPLEFQLLAP
jgi:hypothetical protein